MWIKLHRSLTDWRWFSSPETLQLFIYFLLSANYETKEWQGIKVKRGQLLTTLSCIHKDTSLSLQQIRTAISRLKRTKEIKTDSSNKYTLITVCKYEDYQGEQQTNNTHPTNEQHTYKEYKEINNNISLNNAHAREDNLIPPSLEDCYSVLSSDRSWQESVLINLHSRGYRHILFEQFDEHLKLFFAKLKAEGSDFKHPRDARHHFSNWLLIQLEKQKNEINRTNNQSRKQEANAYALSQFADYYSNMDEEIPNPFAD